MKIIVDAPEYKYYDFVIKTGATEPGLRAQLTDDNDNAIDLTGASVEFIMAEPGGDRVIEDTVTILNPSEGRVAYTWKSADTDTAGQYNAEFAVDYSGDTGSNFVADEYFPSDDYLSIHIMESL